MEPTIEDKIKLDGEIVVARKQLKDTLADLDIGKKELILVISEKDNAKRLTEEKNAELRDTINLIAGEKLAWANQKATEEAEIEAKRIDVQKVLDKEANLTLRSIELDTQESKIKEDTRKNNDILAKIDAGNLIAETDKKYLAREKEMIATHLEGVADKIKKFREGVEKVINELSQI